MPEDSAKLAASKTKLRLPEITAGRVLEVGAEALIRQVLAAHPQLTRKEAIEHLTRKWEHHST